MDIPSSETVRSKAAASEPALNGRADGLGGEPPAVSGGVPVSG